MANRFPITINTSTNRLEELPATDNINLTSSGIYDGYSVGVNGQVLESTGSGVRWTTPFDGNYNSLTNKPIIPAAQVNADWNATSGAAQILNKPTIPNAYTLPTASSSVLGGIKIGSGLQIDNNGIVSVSGGGTSGTGVTDGDKGDISVSNTGSLWTIDNGVVTYGKIQDVSNTNRLLGRFSTGPGDIEEIIIGSGLVLTGSTLSAAPAGNPSGSHSQLQFNDTGVFGSSTYLTVSTTNNTYDTINASVLSSNILNVKGTTSGSISISVPATTTNQTLVLPSSQGSSGSVLTNDGSGNLSWTSGAGLKSRQTSSATTSSLVDGASANLTIVTPKTYALLKIQTSHAAWVTLYTDTASRTSDAARTENTDPSPGSGVIAEVITTGSSTQLITPGIVGFNSSSTEATYIKVVNKSGGSASVTVTLTYVQLEV
jgi:hypothetical protein